MTRSDKREGMRQHLAGLGISPSTAAPPLWKLLWRLGVDLPPPLFMGFWSVALLMGSVFGLFWGVLMWLLLWSRQGMPIGLALGSSVFAAALFGLGMAAYLRHVARKLDLPRWDECSSKQP